MTVCSIPGSMEQPMLIRRLHMMHRLECVITLYALTNIPTTYLFFTFTCISYIAG